MRQSLDRLSTQVLRYIPFLLAFITPIFFLPTTAEFFIFNKFYFLSLLASLSLIAWSVRSLCRGKLTFTASPSLFPLLLLTVTNIISSLWLSPTKYVSLFGQTTLFASLAIIFLTTTSSQKNRLVVNSVVLGLLSSALILSVTTILHYFNLLSGVINAEILSNSYFNLAGGILPALAFTLPIIIATVAYLISTKNWLTRSLLFTSIIIMITASVINLTLIFPKSGQQVIFLLPYRASWSIAVDIFKNWQTALFGSGPETYLTVFTRLRPNYLNYIPSLWNLRFPESGSFFLTLITTTGLIGAVSFLFSFLRPVVLSFKHLSANKDNPNYTFLFITSLLSLLSYLLLPTGIISLVLGFAGLIALTIEFKLQGYKNAQDINLSISAKSEPAELYEDLDHSGKFSPSTLVMPWLLTTFSVILVGVYWLFATPAYSASMLARQASNLIQTNPLGAYFKEVSAQKIDPRNSGYPLVLSQFFKTASMQYIQKDKLTEEDRKNATDYMQRSIDFGKQAAILDPYNPASWENLADIYTTFIGTAENAQSFAISHLAQAIALDPTNPKIRLKLGVLFFNLGDSDQAIKLIGQAIELKQDWDIPYINMSAIYKSKKDYLRSSQYLKLGIQYSTQSSENLTKLQEELKSIEKMIPAGKNATSSANTK